MYSIIWNESLVIFLKLIFCICVFYEGFKWYKNYNSPPGPIGIPFFGYSLFLRKKPHLILTNVSQKYGKLFSVNLRSSMLICVSDFHLAKKLFNHPYVLYRSPPVVSFLPGDAGFGTLNGAEWLEQRRFAMSTLKDLGVGKGTWEQRMQESIENFIHDLHLTNQQPFDFMESLQLYNINNMVSVLFGKNIKEIMSENEIQVMQQTFDQLSELVAPQNWGSNFPAWIFHLFVMLDIKKIGTFYRRLKKVDGTLRREVDKLYKGNYKERRDDFISIYLSELEKRKQQAEPHHFSVDCLIGNIFLFTHSAHESNSMFIGWLLLLMTEYPEVQKRIHDEIDTFIDKNETVYFDDRRKLVYTMATIIEMTRYISPVALVPPRNIQKTFSFEGFTIPKGALLTYNVSAVQHDPNIFEEPMKFKPERFLEENGTELKYIEKLGTFSIGKRNCPGEIPAMMNVFIVFAKIMQQFYIKTPTGERANLNFNLRGGLMPISQKLCFIKR